MLRRSLGFFAFAFVVGLGAPLSASVVSAYDLETLVGRSEHAVAAHVEATSSRYDSRGQIVTDVIVRVAEVGKGRARRGETLQLLVLGGTVGDVTMRVEGSVRFAAGDEAMLFLERHRSGHLIPVGLSQGILPIDASSGRRMVMPGAAGLVLLARDRSGRMANAPGALTAPEALETFVDRVRALAGAGAP